MSQPAPNVAAQVEAIDLDPARPLLICDADEVLFHFMTPFVDYLTDKGCYYDWRTFALTGNVRDKETDRTLSPADVRALINTFFTEWTEHLPPVDGAAQALTSLSADGVQIVILSNLPFTERDARARALRAHAMDYPLVASRGLKGPTVRSFSERVSAPVGFIDDIPHHHDSVGLHAKTVYRVHFSANARLRSLQTWAANVELSASNWDDIYRGIHSALVARTPPSTAST